ncbi:COG3014 family protein [Planctomycetota bacterium]
MRQMEAAVSGRLSVKNVSGSTQLAVVTILLALCTLGCRTQQNRLEQFDRHYTKGDWDGAQTFVEQKTPVEDSVLWTLQRASVERMRQDYQASNESFDRAETMMQRHETDAKGLDVIGSTLVSEGVLPYRGEVYDGIMINTYKALNFMALGRDDLARIEFNRATERQRRAKEYFDREIKQVKKEMSQDKNSGKVDYQKTLDDPNTESKIRSKYSSLYDFEAYPDFMNPFATYLGGVFFSMTGDPAKAIDLLKESVGMVKENRTIEKDFADVDRWLGGGGAIEPSVWVILENGLGPVKQEFRVDLPLFLFTDDVLYAGIALPRLSPRSQAVDSLEVAAGDTWVTTETVANMDRVIQTEFAKDFPAILTRALISATAKALVQHAILKQNTSGNDFLGLVAAVYNVATTVADLRIWTSLPKDFQVARVPMPENGDVRLRWNKTKEVAVSIQPCQYALVYVKKVAAGQEPVVQVVARGRPR